MEVEEITEAFAVFDIYKRGRLSGREIQCALEALGFKLKKHEMQHLLRGVAKRRGGPVDRERRFVHSDNISYSTKLRGQKTEIRNETASGLGTNSLRAWTPKNMDMYRSLDDKNGSYRATYSSDSKRPIGDSSYYEYNNIEVDVDEFVDMILSNEEIIDPQSESQLRQLFDLMDLKGEGYLDIDDLSIICEELGGEQSEAAKHHRINQQDGKLRKGNFAGTTMSTEDLKELIYEVNRKKRLGNPYADTINFEQFYAIMTHHNTNGEFDTDDEQEESLPVQNAHVSYPHQLSIYADQTDPDRTTRPIHTQLPPPNAMLYRQGGNSSIK